MAAVGSSVSPRRAVGEGGRSHIEVGDRVQRVAAAWASARAASQPGSSEGSGTDGSGTTSFGAKRMWLARIVPSSVAGSMLVSPSTRISARWTWSTSPATRLGDDALLELRRDRLELDVAPIRRGPDLALDVREIARVGGLGDDLGHGPDPVAPVGSADEVGDRHPPGARRGRAAQAGSSRSERCDEPEVASVLDAVGAELPQHLVERRAGPERGDRPLGLAEGLLTAFGGGCQSLGLAGRPDDDRADMSALGASALGCERGVELLGREGQPAFARRAAAGSVRSTRRSSELGPRLCWAVEIAVRRVFGDGRVDRAVREGGADVTLRAGQPEVLESDALLELGHG